jgi:peptide/nickel transport system permease protein
VTALRPPQTGKAVKTFLTRRIISGLLSLAGATFIVFVISVGADDPLLLYAKPGGYGVDPAQLEVLRTKLGLDKPVVVQWAYWIGRAAKGDLGRSIFDERPITEKIGQRIGATLKLGVAAWVFATLLGVPLGVLAAVKRGTPWDYVGRFFALFGQAIPNFWLGIVLVLIFAVRLDWLPSSTAGEGFISIRHMVLPVVVLGTSTAAGYLRITRSAMLEVLDSEFIKLARAKGVMHQWVIWKHAFRNALIPPLTVSAVLLTAFITGSVVTETVFAWPGLGRLAVDAVSQNDFPLVTGITLMFVTAWVVMNFLVDLAYAYVDPRIRLA